MVVNSRPITYILSDDLEEPLTPSHLLCGHRVLSLPDPIDVVKSNVSDLTTTKGDLTRRLRHLSKVLEDFWRRWKTEYLLELREAHRYARVKRGVEQSVNTGDVVVVHDDNLPRGLWKIGRVGELMVWADGNVRGVVLKIARKGMNPLVMRRPIQRLFPLEYSNFANQENVSSAQAEDPILEEADLSKATCYQDGQPTIASEQEKRPRRQAFLRAKGRLQSNASD